jgi:WhiB family redox-sensing transcriptional regulator
MLLNDSWREQAACGNADLEVCGKGTDLFFPPRDKALYRIVSNKAKEYCYGTDDTPPCPVRNECLWYAVQLDEQHGIWGGLSHRERNARVRKWHREFRHEVTLEEYILNLNE